MKFANKTSIKLEFRGHAEGPCHGIRWMSMLEIDGKGDFRDCFGTKVKSKKFKSLDCSTVYFLAHFCPVAFFRQMIVHKITLKKTHF
jgi:hypothetical protein